MNEYSHSEALETKHAHPRDKRIRFVDEGHRYFIDGVEGQYISTTALVHTCFGEFDADRTIDKIMHGSKWKPGYVYYGMSRDEIKNAWNTKRDDAAARGTIMHACIEEYYNGRVCPHTPSPPELLKFDAFQRDVVQERGYTPYRTEWCVFDENHRLSGSIDMTFIPGNDPDELLIYDWKRTPELKRDNTWDCGIGPASHLPDTNYWHYAIQLNLYRHILETHYNKKVSGMYLVAFHPESGGYEHAAVPRLESEIDAILAIRMEALA